MRADGQPVVLGLRLVGDESTVAWRDVIQRPARQLYDREVGIPYCLDADGAS